jgi:hypothetical protein
MRRILISSLLLLPLTLHAQRAVTGNTILSATMPAATFEAAAGLTYAGTQSFDLYGLAAVEQHFFVELDGTRVKRLLWVQFEGYHATNNQTYNYTDTTVTHSGQAWHRQRDTWKPFARAARAGSDGARMREFLAAKGWTLPSDLLYERLVWLLDRPARNELMVIYTEDLQDHGLTADELEPGGAALSRRTAMLDRFHERAIAAFSVR